MSGSVRTGLERPQRAEIGRYIHGSDGSYVGALHNFRPTQEASYAGGSPSFVVNIGTVNGEGDGRRGGHVCVYVCTLHGVSCCQNSLDKLGCSGTVSQLLHSAAVAVKCIK